MSLPGVNLYGLGLTGAKRRLKSRAAPVFKKVTDCSAGICTRSGEDARELKLEESLTTSGRGGMVLLLIDLSGPLTVSSHPSFVADIASTVSAAPTYPTFLKDDP
jgi:hypothetical protein